MALDLDGLIPATVLPMASLTRSGAASCSVRNAAWISAARSSTRRCRPPRRSAAAIFERDSWRPNDGVGATANTARASGWASSSNASSAAG